MYRTRLLPVLTLSAGLAMPALTVRADAVISGTPPTLTSQPSRPDQDGIVRGQAALRMKHFDQAERAFGEAYELNPAPSRPCSAWRPPPRPRARPGSPATG
jgi:cytochrome c-type biogenesis protein CcmH/NrfG